MTNSLFKKGETKERTNIMERWMRLFCSLNSELRFPHFPEVRVFKKSCWTTKTKGAGTSQATVALQILAGGEGGEVLLIIQTVKSDYGVSG